ncbi:hypothetical protein Nepgr_017964 [Nepenthes gracilis]|uniref:Uncharacterized protein n=1 Tax=Nepenthes gracilis TaxID=150966 RepID=A0AAD3XT09_NEPGR|nr:hypothetical protein Nepgr_017964 [Nepenthes gracilis]
MSCAVIDPVESKETLPSPTLIGEASSMSSLDASKEKEVKFCDGLVERSSYGNLMIPHPPLCEAISAVEEPCHCPCAGDVLVPSSGEVPMQVVPTEDGSWGHTKPCFLKRYSLEPVVHAPLIGWFTDLLLLKVADSFAGRFAGYVGEPADLERLYPLLLAYCIFPICSFHYDAEWVAEIWFLLWYSAEGILDDDVVAGNNGCSNGFGCVLIQLGNARCLA